VNLLRTALLALLVAAGSPFSAAQETVEVAASGQGVDERAAIYDALLAAIAQHSGMSIESQQELRRLSRTRETDQGSSASIATSFADQIKTATKGEVLGYELIEQGRTEQGLVRVRLTAKLGVYRRSVQTERLRIAVPGFRPGGEFERLLTAKVASLLAQTRKFAVLERDWAAESAQETALLRDGNTPASERVRIGQRLGADYLLIGSVERLNVRAGNPAPDDLLAAVASCVVDFRLVEFATGQIKVAKVTPLRISALQARAAGGDPGVALVQAAASHVADLITDTAYPITLVGERSEAGEVALNQGGERLKPGARFQVIALGETIRDPQTKEILGREELPAGLVEIVRVAPKMSHAKVLEETRRLEAGMILRAAPPAADPGAGKLQLRKNDPNW
jgi:hypothetical protein